MRNCVAMSVRRTLFTALGLALVGCAAALPVKADQDNTSANVYDWSEPFPMSYVYAAPGGLHLYHWKSYNRNNIVEGSVSDARREMDRKWEEKIENDRKSADSALTEQERQDRDYSMTEPLPMDYLDAAPGGLHLYHWNTYNRNDIKTGSVADDREKRREMADKRWMDYRQSAMVAEAGMTSDERSRAMFHRTEKEYEEEWAEPLPMSYLYAAPGGIHLYHWKTYNRNNIKEGSVNDQNDELNRKQFEKMYRMRTGSDMK